MSRSHDNVVHYLGFAAERTGMPCRRNAVKTACGVQPTSVATTRLPAFA